MGACIYQEEERGRETLYIFETCARFETTAVSWNLFSQESWIQHATVRDNIVFGKEFKADKYEAVIHACALQQVSVGWWLYNSIWLIINTVLWGIEILNFSSQLPSYRILPTYVCKCGDIYRNVRQIAISVQDQTNYSHLCVYGT